MSRRRVSADRVALVIFSLAALAAGLPVASAEPQPAVLAFDFDTDQDPTTIENEIVATPGDLVRAYLVLNDFPLPYELLGAAQFGLEFTPGLRLEGMMAGTEQGAILNDGYRGIAVAWGTPFMRYDLPIFTATFIFEVLSEETQTVRVVPSSGWGETLTGILFAVRSASSSSWVEVEVTDYLEDQVAGIVRGSGDVPAIEATWGSIKRLFADGTF